MKKILLLGGSSQQVVAIKTAKKLGYYTILCDYLEDNPGQFTSDKFYLASTTDKELILRIAIDEKIDGIIAYASDPAAPTAAYVAEKMGLPGNPYQSVETLCNKDKFRKFLKDNGFNVPKAFGFSNIDEIRDAPDVFKLPVIVKPVDSSGSKGATVLNSWEGLEDAVKFAFSFSRCKRAIIEEFIENKLPYLIGGDLFVWNGEVVMWGLMNCHRDLNVNPLVPVGKSFPPNADIIDLDSIKITLQGIIEKLKIKSGAMNVELVVDKNDKVWPIDIGPRNGGNMIPDLLTNIFKVDVVKMTIQTAMGESPDMPFSTPVGCYATHNLHSDRNGKFVEIRYSQDIEPFITRECIYINPGDSVEFFDNSSKAIGIVFFHFNSEEIMKDILRDINNHIKIVLDVDSD